MTRFELLELLSPDDWRTVDMLAGAADVPETTIGPVISQARSQQLVTRVLTLGASGRERWQYSLTMKGLARRDWYRELAAGSTSPTTNVGTNSVPNQADTPASGQIGYRFSAVEEELVGSGNSEAVVEGLCEQGCPRERAREVVAAFRSLILEKRARPPLRISETLHLIEHGELHGLSVIAEGRRIDMMTASECVDRAKMRAEFQAFLAGVLTADEISPESRAIAAVMSEDSAGNKSAAA